MDPKSVFNASVCLIGALILLVHIVNVLFKKDRRKDENSLLSFFIFTMFHFLLYLGFVLVKEKFVHSNYQNDAFIIACYTIFYIFNNVEVLLFYLYFTSYSNIDKKIKKPVDITNYVLFGLIVTSIIVNIFTRMYFTSIDGTYTRGSMWMMVVSQSYQFIMLAICFVLVAINKQLNKREKIAFSIYCVLPLLSIVFQNIFAGYAIAYLVLLLSVEILFLFLNVEKNIKLREEEKQLKEANIKIMVSQIQPHFVYNTLSSISTLIPIEPNNAQKALDEFTDYLRMNFSTLTSSKPVPFEDELKHIKTYVSLEQLRFKNRVKANYDIQVTSFFVPPLSIQPLVENAIKHGILKKVEGGTVNLKTYETDNSYIIEVSDNGVGFDINSIDFKNNKHIGLNNVRHRIGSISRGKIDISSEIGKGTKVTVTINK